MIIVKRGTNASCFALKKGVTITLHPEPVLNVIPDALFEQLMAQYGSFIKPRIQSDKNPNGCFIVQTKKENASAQKKEAGVLKDGSAQLDGETLKKAEETVTQTLSEIQNEKKVTGKKKK